jgi:hypothetical protein
MSACAGSGGREADVDEATRDFVVSEVTRRFPPGALQHVLVLEYGDDPAVEPGSVGVRVIIDPARYPGGGDHPLPAFRSAHRDTLDQLRSDLNLLPRGAWLEFQIAGDDRRSMRMSQGGAQNTSAQETMRRLAQARPGGSTPVTARLEAEQLETLDTLITAGIAANRAEAVRWALDRIRERPAYERLRERAREIDKLKDEF